MAQRPKTHAPEHGTAAKNTRAWHSGQNTHPSMAQRPKHAPEHGTATRKNTHQSMAQRPKTHAPEHGTAAKTHAHEHGTAAKNTRTRVYFFAV